MLTTSLPRALSPITQTSLPRILLILALVATISSAPLRRRSSTHITASQSNYTNATDLASTIESLENDTGSAAANGNHTTCNRNCPDTEDPVCGSDGLTYKSLCALQLKNCQEGRKITVRSAGRCHFNCTHEEQNPPTLPPGRTERMHKLEVFGLCFVSKTATFSDLTKFPFQASCSKEDPTLFAPVQRNKVCKASWCSTPDGVAIEGTLIYGNKQPDCSGRKGCQYEGANYVDGEVFKGSCGVCECLNGNVSCIKDFCNTTEGTLSDEQLTALKSDIIHLFHFQFQHFKQHVLIDLRYIRSRTVPIQDFKPRYLNEVLNWKFDFFDKNENGVLQPAEIHSFHGQVLDLINAKPRNFESQMQGCMDGSQDRHLSRTEWITYFTTDVCEGSGSSTGSNSGETSRNERSASKLHFRISPKIELSSELES